MYKSLAMIIPQKPWLGWSERDYAGEQRKQVAQGDVSDVIVKMANTHNTYLEKWVFQGVMGVVLLIALMVTALTYFIRRLRSQDPGVQVEAVCGASLLVAYSVRWVEHTSEIKSLMRI